MSKIEITEDRRCRILDVVDLSTAMELRRELQAELDTEQDYHFELEGVKFEGSAILPLLVFVARHMREGGGSITFTGVSPRLMQMMDLAGVEWLISVAQAPAGASASAAC